jgi:ribosomal protein L37E
LKKNRIKLCPECGVPRRIIRENIWQSNGKIVERKNPAHRMIFIEDDSISGVFGRIEEILGLSIERIIVESERKLAYDYVSHFVPAIVRKFVRLTHIDLSSRSTALQGQLMGFGDIEIISKRLKGDEGDYIRLGVKNAWFPAALSGIVAGSMEALICKECTATYEEKSPGYFEFTTSVSTRDRVFEERLPLPEYSNKRGDIKLERCGTCGGPAALRDFEWQIGPGMIANRQSGQRVVLTGPGEYEAIFKEMEKELGEDITRAVIEAQRGFVKGGPFQAEDTRDPSRLRTELAFRGLGNLRKSEWLDGRLSMRLENPCLNPVLIGMVLGLFELAAGGEGEAEWEQATDGDLTIEISPKV